jgi:signal peptidase II
MKPTPEAQSAGDTGADPEAGLSEGSNAEVARRGLSIALVTLVIALVADLATKALFFAPGPGGEGLGGTALLIHLNELWKDWIWVELRINKGVAWSMLASTPWLVVALTVVLVPVLMLVYWFAYRKTGATFEHLAFGAIIGGALGNAYDRIKGIIPRDPHAGVRDFIHVDLNWVGIPYIWPTFNIADAAISVGFFVLVFGPLLFRSKAKTKSTPTT